MARKRSSSGGKYYAYSNIRYSDADGNIQTVGVGAEVTQSMLGLDDDAWNTRLQRGIIRTTPYPKVPSGVSLKRHKIREATAALEEAMDSSPTVQEVDLSTGEVTDVDETTDSAFVSQDEPASS